MTAPEVTTIQIAIGEPPPPGKEPVVQARADVPNAKLYGGIFAVHPTPLVSETLAIVGYGDDFVITHAPTGMYLARYLTSASANAIARAWSNVEGVAALADVAAWRTPEGEALANTLLAIQRAIVEVERDRKTAAALARSTR